jgi:hypothetical protein
MGVTTGNCFGPLFQIFEKRVFTTHGITYSLGANLLVI